ncbi:MAG: DUF1684 domain-containing protein [Gemmatimonadetes bacterium]|nr:DUF1684 domain-containing protein [Gemmatimonadota bacterium]NNF11769.1 DUF1684 domain-containing protein [Gemmatimonadota bacterium]
MADPPSGRLGRMAILSLVAGCAEPWPEPPVVDTGVFAEEHEDWRSRREARAVEPPGGPVLWIGLWDLPHGETVFGADPGLPIALPAEDSPPIAGTLTRQGEAVRLEPAPGAAIRVHEGDLIEGPIELRHDRMEDPTRLQLGSLGLRVHSEQGTDRLWLRAWDEDTPERETFRLPDYFPVDPAWRVQARFEPYVEPEPLRVPDVTGGMVEFIARGELVFRRGRKEHRLIATAGETSSSYFVMMWDSTAVDATYQGGRYLRVDFPDESGWTTIDFNRTYNAPCVFTAYSVCGLPPRRNWLPLRVEAGEQRPN